MAITTTESPTTVVPPDEATPGTLAATRTDQFPSPRSIPGYRPAAPRRKGPSFDQYLVSQLPLALAVALIFGMITFAAVHSMPTGGMNGGTVAPIAVGAGSSATGGGAPITAFSGGTAAQQIQIAADPSGALKWGKATYEAQAGDVTFVVTNKSVSTHNFAIEGGSVKVQSPNFGSNTTNSYTIKGLPVGEYQIICNFPGHREAGMVAKLIVR
jgi:plastocyanin